MREVTVPGLDGLRFLPDEPGGTAALVLTGSSGRVDADRARLLAHHGVVAESVRWFGGPDQQPGPWEVPLELFLARVESLSRESERVTVIGTSFGAEAAVLTGAHSALVHGVAAFAPSDVVWAGITTTGRVTSHWTLGGVPFPFVPFAEDWAPGTDPPAFRELYRISRDRAPDDVRAAAIPVERIGELLLVAGGDDQVWPSLTHAEAIRARRSAHGLATDLVTDPAAGHRAILPGETVPVSGMRMARGGTEQADRQLGAHAWPALLRLVGTSAQHS